MRWIPLLVAFLLMIVAGSAVGQGDLGGLRLTVQQQRMLEMLPAADRENILRQIRGLQREGGSGTTTNNAAISDAMTFARAREDGTERGLDADALDSTVIRPDDTLVIEIAFPPRNERETGVVALIPRTHLLLGKHVVELDGAGRLSMPGIREVPLAGLDAAQAELRLMAEPTLQEMVVAVTRLTLKPVGRDALKPFGHEIFQRGARRADQLSFMPNFLERPTQSAPADYIIGPGDTLQLFFFGKDGGTVELLVTREGFVNAPNLGPVSVAGLSFSAAKEMLERRVREETIGTQASVSMGELRSIEVLVVGEVDEPGAQVVGSLSTVINALYEAGGITEAGSLRDIRLLRGDGVHGTFDLYELLLHGNPQGDLRLQSNDIVFVPKTGPRVGIVGETLRPAWYEIKGKSTVGEILDQAGTTVEADAGRTQIQRLDDNGEVHFFDVDATARSGRNTPVMAGDVLNVPRAARIARNALTLQGHFAQPGTRQWKDGIRVSDILRGGAALRPDADLDYGLIIRRLDDGRGIGVHMFSPRSVIDEPGSDDNHVLMPRDTVFTFGFDDDIGRQALIRPIVEELRRQATRDTSAQVVQVTGAVRVPGFYPLADGMRIDDLMKAGGGLDESAYGASAEITRFVTDSGAEREITHVEVDLERALAGDPTQNLVVQSHDVLNIKTVPQWELRGSIEIRGEVRFPGVYAIRPGETLSSIIERAGGLTEFAYPNAAVFTRATLRQREQEQIERMVRRLEADIAAAAAQGGASGAQAQALGSALVEQLKETEAAGRLVIDLNRLLRSPEDPNFDVLATDGDLLAIPSRPQEVTVLGEVNFTTSHVFTPGADRNDYIASSGGLTARADKGRIYIVRANGAVEATGRWRSKADVMPGDTIVVPLDADRLPPMARVMNISQVLYQLAIAAAAWNSLGVL